MGSIALHHIVDIMHNPNATGAAATTTPTVVLREGGRQITLSVPMADGTQGEAMAANQATEWVDASVTYGGANVALYNVLGRHCC